MEVDKKILSVDADDEDIDLKTFSKFLHDDTARNKNKVAKEFEEFGEDLLAEIEEKKLRKNIEKNKLILYILKHDKKTTYSQRLLNSYSYEDVQEIYDEIRKNKNVIQKIFHFIFNL